MPGKIEGGKRQWEVQIWHHGHGGSVMDGSWYLDDEGKLQKDPNPKVENASEMLDNWHEWTRLPHQSDLDWLKHLPAKLNGMNWAEPVGPEWKQQEKTYDEPGLDD